MFKPIPCLDLSRQHQTIKSEILSAFEAVYDKTAFSGGEFVEKFEREFANYVGVKNCVAVSNGTVALHLAMLALGIGPGDEVIVPSNSFIATAWGVSHAGATPVFVDCDDTWNLDFQNLEKAITKKTKAIIGVHLYGQPFDIDEAVRVCNKYELFLIEDAAQAQGAMYKDRMVGTFGDVACYSFYPGKNLGACGEGGAVVTNQPEIANVIRALRNHGSTVRYHHEVVGYNYRMGGLEAASLSVKLRYLDIWNKQRRSIADRYKSEIRNKKLIFQSSPSWANSVFHLFVVIVDDKSKFVEYLKKEGIIPAFHYPVPCHLQKAYANLGYQQGDLPVSEHLAGHCVSIPMFPELTNTEIEYVIDVLNRY